MISNYLLQPEGLVALLALIPLIIFYLVKPKPEEMLLPSLRFFMEDKKDGKIQQALSKILQNLMLLFHILFVTVVAVAIAGPFVNAEASSDRTVVILDNSASMEDDMEEARNFVQRNLGEENTLIVVNDEAEVLTEEASASQVLSAARDVESVDTSTNMVSALRKAQSYEGDVVLASDVDHSTDSQDAESLIEDISVSRTVEVMEAESQNSWGIVNLDSSEEWVEVKNYKDSSQEIEVSFDDENRNVELQSSEVRRISLELQEGENTVSLPEDEFETDNTAYIYVPQIQNLETALISDNENQYLYQALDLINSTAPEYYETPVENVPESDVYIIGESENLLASTVSEVEDRVEEGATLIVFGEEDMDEDQFSSLPVENLADTTTENVRFNEPRSANVGQTEVIGAEVTGESLSEPEQALAHGEHGEGDVVFYNINDEDFRTGFMYPVFWKDLINTYSEVETVQDVTVRTGYAEGIVDPGDEITETGFHNTSRGTVAVNLINEEESSPSTYRPENVEGAQTTVPKSIQNQFSLIVLLLALSEFAYLIYIGDMEW